MNAQSFHSAVVPLYRRLYVVAIGICRDEADAADAVQDAMVKLWNARDRLDHVRSLEAFAVTTLRHSAIDIVSARYPEQSLECLAEMSADDSGDETRCEALDIVSSIISSLPPPQRHVIELNAYDGLSASEIAEATGLSSANVRQLLSRGRRKIKEIFQKIST